MQVHEFSDILQDIAHEGKAKYILKINGTEFDVKDIRINKDDKNNVVEISIKR